MFKAIILTLLFLSCTACDTSSETTEPYAKYSARFDNSKIDAFEIYLDSFAKNNKLEIFRKNRDQMKNLSNSKEAFFTAFYFKGDPVLIITNVGNAKTLTLTATDYKKMPIKNLEHLTNTLIKATKKELDVELSTIKQK